MFEIDDKDEKEKCPWWSETHSPWRMIRLLEDKPYDPFVEYDLFRGMQMKEFSIGAATKAESVTSLDGFVDFDKFFCFRR